MTLIEEMRDAGAHFGYAKSRRHPSTGKYVFTVKNNIEVFNLEKTSVAFEKALKFVKELGAENKTILFVGTKNESKRVLKTAAESIEAPYVYNRWIGGTMTNWSEIKKRIQKIKDMKAKKEAGEYEEKYTKKERLLLDRELDSLQDNFGGIVDMEKLPDALFVVDPGHESIAVDEAEQLGIPVVALANNDCKLTNIEYPIPANDSTVKSLGYFINKITKAYMEGKLSQKAQ